MKPLSHSVRAALRRKREGSVITAESLSKLGTRSAIDQTLSRLAAKGEIMRIARGAYVVPRKGEFGSFPPSAERVVRSMAKRMRKPIVPDGGVAANRFGLTTQQPIRRVYLTSGRSSSLALGSNPVELRHVPKWQTVLPGEPAGEAVRAMAYLGKEQAKEAASRLKERLEPSQWEKLNRIAPKLPKWVGSAIAEVELRG
ncbi:DUF6088 family protein [Methylobacterium symbioticum]|uniref:Type IV toxin-antitoxin system AbiEi family antitoxin domain-containing protein n=1 Tax=Methylobacterium symbioticum TaxID=2584084 RepID=A0A509EFB3_9HYPH|nr:DUF6088 family protein [Methylobacterium symbioticum]VUD72284.1 hypothetical protein MET9862_02879 [Methylobacterium symbioticum]